MIEIGVPFSDPMADGKTIQHSSTVALNNGMNLQLLLSQIAEARKEAPDTPLVLMGYLNPMIQYGIERLFERCKEVGIDALIIPDLPFGEYMSDYKALCDKYDIPIIMLITPETDEQRIQLIDKNCSGFIYMVSSASTTGTKDRFTDEQIAYFKRINRMPLQHNRLTHRIRNIQPRDTARSLRQLIGSHNRVIVHKMPQSTHRQYIASCQRVINDDRN